MLPFFLVTLMGTIRFYHNNGEYNLESNTVKELKDETAAIFKDIREIYSISAADAILNVAAREVTIHYVCRILHVRKRVGRLLVDSALSQLEELK